MAKGCAISQECICISWFPRSLSKKKSVFHGRNVLTKASLVSWSSSQARPMAVFNQGCVQPLSEGINRITVVHYRLKRSCQVLFANIDFVV